MKTFTGVIAALSIAATAHAQGANVDVSVYPQAVAGQSPPTRAGFLVCIGTTTDLDKYGTETTTTSGVANQNFKNLPTGAQVRVTVTKSGYIGVQFGATLREGWNNHLNAQMNVGTGGPVCASSSTSTTSTSTTVSISGTALYPIAPTTVTQPVAPPPAPRLGQEIRTHWGRQLPSSSYTTLDCKAFGNDYVIVGITGRDGEGIDAISLKCKKLESNGALQDLPLPAPRFTATVGGTAGTGYEVNCGPRMAVVGIKGTMLKEQVRGLTIRCQPLLNGLVNSTNVYSPQSRPAIGNETAPPWGPDDCSRGRPARAIKVGKDIFLSGIPLGNLFAPNVIAAVQLICEQPPYN